MKVLAINNLLFYWRMFGKREIKMPKGAENVIGDTIQALEEYKEILQKKRSETER